MSKVFEFDEKAAVEAILYMASRSRKADFQRIAKLFYFADRAHLEKYGRFICGDEYVAMKHGPVPSRVYDMLKTVRDGYSYIHFPEAAQAFKVEANYHVTPLRPPDLEWLSDSDLECLDAAIAQYDGYDFSKLTQLSHDDAWCSADENDFISLEAIVQSIGNPEGLLEHYFNKGKAA